METKSGQTAPTDGAGGSGNVYLSNIQLWNKNFPQWNDLHYSSSDMSSINTKSTGFFLYEFPSGTKYGPASSEDVARFQQALQEGKQFIEKGHHGYNLKFYVSKLK